MNSKPNAQSGEQAPASRSATWTVRLILLAALTLPFSMTGCSARWAGCPVDSRLTAPVVQPEIEGRTCRDVIRLAVEQRHVIEDCADRMDAIRGLSR
jgi:hypothetical protein